MPTPIPALRDAQFGTLAPFVVIVAGQMLVMFVPMPSALRAILLVAMAVTFLVMAMRFFRIRARVRELRARVHAGDGKVCTTCGYDLVELCVDELGIEQKSVVCPECGSDHRVAALQARWYAAKFWMP